MEGTAWVPQFAAQLICEIAEQMGGVRLTCQLSPLNAAGREMDAVSVLIDGEYSFSLRFNAERSIFSRFAGNMLGREPSEEEIQIYAGEFFNVVCGRFVSEVINRANIKVRLTPVSYEPQNQSRMSCNERAEMQTLSFVSDKQEYAVFSWTALPIEEMLRRNMS